MKPTDTPLPRRRDDPAWVWYVVAGLVLVGALIVQFTGLFDRFAP